VGGSVGKTLGSLSVLELAALQVRSLEENLFDISWDLTPKSFEQSFGWIRVIN
jgi:hypothetical protein